MKTFIRKNITINNQAKIDSIVKVDKELDKIKEVK